MLQREAWASPAGARIRPWSLTAVHRCGERVTEATTRWEATASCAGLGDESTDSVSGWLVSLSPRPPPFLVPPQTGTRVS